MLPQLSIGLLLGVLIAGVAWRAGALSRSGAWAAAVVGGMVFGLGGLTWAVLLLTFFVSSSVLSRAFVHRKSGLGEKFSKGNRRDWGQVVANGGVGIMLVVIPILPVGYWPHEWFQFWPWVGYAGAMAAVTADTWGTELGVLSRRPPRLITNGRRVERGTSGAISLLGSLASLFGSTLIGLVACLIVIAAEPCHIAVLPVFASVTIGGVSGSFLDSLLGATMQANYYCPVCEKHTEHHPLHTCGTGTTHVRGSRWLNNDWVNFFTSLVGTIVALGTWFVLS